MANQTHCARPGCGLTRVLHGYSASACSNFIQPGTKEANTIKRERTVSCPRCGGRTDGVKPEPTMRGMVQAACDCSEAPTLVSDFEDPSHFLDRKLMTGALEHLQARIANATGCLTRGLSYQRSKMDQMAQREFQAALKHLGGLGAS